VQSQSDSAFQADWKFVDDIGLYLKGAAMDVCENDSKLPVATQRKWKVVKIEG
jgi:hypothetical protein